MTTFEDDSLAVDLAALHHDLVEHSPDGMVVVDAEGRIVLVNRAIEVLFGYDRSALLGAAVEVLVPDRLRDGHHVHRRRFQDEPVRRAMGVARMLTGRRSDGSEFPVEITLAAIGEEDFPERLVAASVRDVTAKQAAEVALQAAEAKFRNTFLFSGVGMALTEHGPGRGGRISECNDALADLLAGSSRDLIGCSFVELHAGEGATLARRAASDLLAGQRVRVEYDTALRWRDVNDACVHVTSSLIGSTGGPCQQLVHHVHDLRARRKLETELRFLADHDELSGLLNRRRFLLELERAILHGERYGRPWALLLIDLDGFKQINDTFGHGAGDELIAGAARAIKRRVRATDTVGRIGGDEFAVIVEEATQPEAEHVANELVSALRTVHAIRGFEIRGATASIGVALVDAGEAVLPQAILHNADVAMFAAKHAGGDRIALYEDAGCA